MDPTSVTYHPLFCKTFCAAIVRLHKYCISNGALPETSRDLENFRGVAYAEQLRGTCPPDCPGSRVKCWSATITTKDLAVLARLSSYHFCRAFRDSFGASPHGYLMRRRVERAKGLMLTTNASLGQIAADCGLSDQAHFNKLFRRFVGESPGAWRRARATAPGARWLRPRHAMRPRPQ